MHPAARTWFDRRTSAAEDWDVVDLLAAKGDARVLVVLPALDEAATVGGIVTSIRRHLRDGLGLVDRILVLDSGSTDATAEVAAAAGADVVHRDDVLPDVPAGPGKGEAMWRALAASDEDVVVFIDADLRSFTPTYVVGLLGPLLTDPEVQLVKAMYERPLVLDGVVAAGGGRVTELVARPLLNLHWPQLSGVVQPLAGEYAARRTLLERLPFPCGYGVELALLVDALDLVGLDALAQVDLGVRVHRHHDERRLGRMAAEILRTATVRLARTGGLPADRTLGTSVAQFDRGPDGFHVTTYDVSVAERPPLVEVPGYRATPASARHATTN